MSSAIRDTFRRLKWLLVVIGVAYVLSIGAGLATWYVGPEALRTHAGMSDAQSDQVEKMFGPYRQSIREGRIGAILACSAIVLTFNTIGNFFQHTLPSILILPGVITLVGGWSQGMTLAGIHGSSFLSVFLFVLMGAMEWVTYVMATASGVNIGLSLISPGRQGVDSRRRAFDSAWRDAGRLYMVIALILAAQAVFEVIYVRRVLLSGGSGVPLMPY